MWVRAVGVLVAVGLACAGCGRYLHEEQAEQFALLGEDIVAASGPGRASMLQTLNEAQQKALTGAFSLTEGVDVSMAIGTAGEDGRISVAEADEFRRVLDVATQ